MKKYILWIIVIILAITGYFTQDIFTWFLETVWVMVGMLIITVIYQKPITSLLGVLLFIHALILIIGGYYTYAEVPLGFWMQDWFGFSRNHYDRIGHIAQGFVPAILMREIYRRKAKIANTGWLFLFIVSFCLAFSALFEMMEWWSAIAFGSGSDAFLGTQGDIWDAQWDMFFCLLGSFASLLLLGRWHERQIQKIRQ